jgi:hypothetical protein
MQDFNSMTIVQLAEVVRSGAKITVTCKKRIEDNESYAEGGMRAILVHATGDDGDGTVKITLDFTPFDEFNKSFETPNYFDAHHKPTLTARQYGAYKPVEQYYFDSNEKVSDIFEAVDEAQYQLLAEHKAQAEKGQSYVSWLEQQVLALRKAQ